MIEKLAVYIALFLLRLSRFLNWLGVESCFFEKISDRLYYYYNPNK
jgi:hypothetical protein